MTVLIPALPTPVPQSTDPVNFAARADAFLAALPGFATAANQQADENNQLNASTVAAAARAKEASDMAIASTLASRFDPNATYPAGVLVWSPIDGKTYRRKVAGKAAADPSADAVNWMRQVLTKADFGLGNVDNTSDAEKPLSAAMQLALSQKETPAGALEQMQGFGLGRTTTPLIEALDGLRATGMYRISAATALSVGLEGFDYVIQHIAGVTAGSGHRQIAYISVSSPSLNGRVWQRVSWGGVWGGWRSMPSSDYGATTALASNTVIDTRGDLLRSTSSARYKTDVEPVDAALMQAVIDGAKPVWYRSLCDADPVGHSYWGLIAEDLGAVDPRYVHWRRITKAVERAEVDEEGQAIILTEQVPDFDAPLQAEGVMYERLVVPLLWHAKQLQERLEALELRVMKLEKSS